MSELRNHGEALPQVWTRRPSRVAVVLTTSFVFAAAMFAPLAGIDAAHAAVNADDPANGGPLPATPAKASSLRYVVANGDYLWGIAIKLGVKFGDLLSVNAFTMETMIHPGQSVVVPEGGTLPAPASTAPQSASTTQAAPAPATSSTAAYVIASGDSLAGIAKKLGVTLTALLTANKLAVTSVIHPGGQLTVPAGGRLPAPTVMSIANAASTAQPVTAGRVGNAAAAPAAPPTAAPVATAGATPVAADASAGFTSYTVVNGDYLVGIATRRGVTLKALLTANNLITTSAIVPGMALSVPPATLPIPVEADTNATSDSSGDAAATNTAGPTKIATILTFLQAQVGKAYVFNTAGPDTYDCSGLVSAAYDQVGISLPHQSLLQSTKGTAVDWHTEALLPGDLIFQFSTANPTVISHVGIVIDATHWIQAAGSGTPVKIGPLPSSAKIQAVRRIVQP